jgi:serine O-acetyltransferase
MSSSLADHRARRSPARLCDPMLSARDEMANLASDLERYGRRPWLREQSVWAVTVYRLGRAAEGLRQPLRWMSGRLYWPVYRLVETLTGISLPRTARIGPGLRIHHFGGIVIHPDAVIGAGCTMRHGVTIGEREEGGSVPTIEDGVDIGAYAQLLGGIRIGSRARIGAMSVVLTDVPADAAAVGNPARVI